MTSTNSTTVSMVAMSHTIQDPEGDAARPGENGNVSDNVNTKLDV